MLSFSGLCASRCLLPCSVGPVNFDGTFDDVTSDGRTSTNAWCGDTVCHDDALVGPILVRIEEMTGVPDSNHEWLQLLRYEPGQYYNEHHDFNDLEGNLYRLKNLVVRNLYLNMLCLILTHHLSYCSFSVDRPQGPRILTVFLYLSDVEKGGGTQFGKLDLRVMPKKGRVLIWPSVLDEDFMEMDERTHHEALPVEEGLKFAANSWLHLRDFKKPHHEGCS
jgi:prolyl 4-hydroxylase